MSVWGAVTGGLVGTLVLTTGLRAASELGWTRMDLTFLLGTALFDDRSRAKAAGYALHFIAGQAFALLYYAVFTAIDESGWLLGALLGLLHAAFAGTALVNVLLPAMHPRMGTPNTSATSNPLLEPPGFMMLNYGRATPAVSVAVHIVYGAIVGGFTSLSG
jgi:hypothetical protein